MDVRKLRHFLAVYQHASIRKAAELLLLTQPALSKSIRQLEMELGVELFERTPLGVVPTVFGEALAAHARVIQTEVQAAETALANLRGAGRGRVRVGVGPSVAVSLLPRVTHRILTEAPDLTVVVEEGLVDDLLPALRKGELDLAIGSWPRAEDADLTTRVLLTDHIEVLAAADHPLAGRRVTLTDLLAYPWALPPENQRWRQHLATAFLAQGLDLPSVKAVSNSAAYLKSLLEGSHFLTYLPSQLVRLGEEGRIVQIAAGLDVTIDVTLTRRHNVRLSPAAQAFIGVLDAVVADLTGTASGR
jgi:DNA-binding transcriptional LysR family regulator